MQKWVEKEPDALDMDRDQMNRHFYKEWWRLLVAKEIMQREIEKIRNANDA